MKTPRTATSSLLAALVLLAGAAGTASAQGRASWDVRPAAGGQAGWTPESTQTPVSELPCTTPQPESGPQVVVKAGSEKCGAAGSFQPLPAEMVACLQSETRQYLWEQYQLGELIPGTKLTAAQVESRILAYPIPVQMYAWPIYLELGAANAQPWTGCAAGIAWKTEIWVSLKDGEVRGNKLVAWETANNIVAWGLNRHDLGDSTSVVAAATNRAYAVCTAVPYAMR